MGHLPIAPVSVKGFSRDGIVSEKHSGFKENSELVFTKDGSVQYRIDRPKFYRLVQYLHKGYFKGVIVLCWDRASRNKGDNNIIEKLIKQGIDFQFTLANYDKTSSGALHMDIDGMVAQHHSRVTSEKVRLATKDQRSRGICTYKAPVGYINPGTMEDKPFDPDRAPVIKQMFELYATGNWSLADLARFANQQGMTMPAVRRRRTDEEILAEEEDDVLLEIERVCRPVNYIQVHKILTNPFYTGKVLGNDRMYIQSASHSALISDEVFDTVQYMLKKKNVSVHYTQKLDSPYRGLVRCALCSRVYTPYVQKGITYYGARCKKECPNPQKNFNKSFLEKEIGSIIHRLSLTEDEFIELEARAKTDIALFEVKRHSQLDQIDRRKRKIREDLTYLRNNRLILLRSEVYTPETYLKEERKLNTELTTLQNEEQVSDATMHEVIKDVIKLSELLKSLCFHYKNSNSKEKEEIIRNVFSELTISEMGLQYKCVNGLQVLGNRFVTLGDPTTWISEAVKYHNLIRQSIHDLEIMASITRPP